jgi:predicted DNA-binding protein
MLLDLKLPKKLETELENLATITGKPKELHFKEALIKYVEDVEEIREVSRLRKGVKKVDITVKLPKD